MEKLKIKGKYFLINYIFISLDNSLKCHLTYSTKNKRNNINMSNKIYYNSNKNIIKNFTNSAFENIINMNSSKSTKKEKINNVQVFQNLNNSKKTLIINNSKISLKKINKSSEILTDILRGIISLKKNNLFDYVIIMLKIFLYYYKGNNIISRNNFLYELDSDDNALNLFYQNIFQVLMKETHARQMLMNDFNNNKYIFKSIHCIFMFYIYSGIEHINDIINKVRAKTRYLNINNYLDFSELLNILLLFINKEKCQTNSFNLNSNNNNSCMICSKLDKMNKFNFNKNKFKTIDKSSDVNININVNCNEKPAFNVHEKIIFDYNHKHIKNKYKIKKNMSNFINSDISLKMLKSSNINKSLKKNSNNTNQNINITNNSNDKRFLKYLKTTIDDKIHNNILNSHRDSEIIGEKKDKIYSELKNYISYENNKNKNNKSAKKIYNYSYKKNNIINLSNKNNGKEYNSLQNFFIRKNKDKRFSSKTNKVSSNININNNHQIFLYPKVEQYLNNVYIINNSNKNANDKIYKEKKEKRKENIIDTKCLKEDLSKDKKDIKDEIKKEINTNDIFNYMEVINKQINSMENIFDNFKAQTMKIKQEMLEIENKNKLI